MIRPYRLNARSVRTGTRAHGTWSRDQTWSRPGPGLYGDSMILAECIFSQSATGEVSSAYFRKLAISRTGCGVQIRNFRKRREGGEEGEEEEDEEEEEEEEEEPDYFDSSGDEINSLCET